ncbi:MAG TPA: hypothetical protein VF074_17515, partial [Pyrinomonadaceae bacterium]
KSAKAQRRIRLLPLRFCAFASEFLLIIAGLLLCFSNVVAQEKQTYATISVPTNGQVKIDAELSAPARSWSFRNSYAKALGLAERVEDFRAVGESGQDARVRKSAVGEFRSELDATKISYTVKLSNPRADHLPHVSWLEGDRGILMFADLTPIDFENLSSKFILPPGWTVESAITPDANGQYLVSNPLKAVFLVGGLLRKRSNTVEGMLLETAVSGTWSFKDDDALKMASQVMKKHFALTGFRLPGKSVILIAPIPASSGEQMWRAETRGSTVVILVNPAARKQMFTKQLGVVFSHELLHLWVPNALKLEGDYDWFFEGFTMYAAALAALELKIIKFQGFLNTLGGAYKYYLDHPDNVSLIEASETRWTSGWSHVYIKAMLVAFLYDLMIRKESGGKSTLADRYRELFNGGAADSVDGNKAIISVLGSSPALKNFTKSFIENKRELKLEEFVREYGLQLHLSDIKRPLTVSDNLDDGQKQVLRSLGY